MTDLKGQFAGALLVVLTLAAVICAGINFQQQKKFHLPEDGVTWVDRAEGVEALHIVAASQADNAGLRTGDRMVSINGVPIRAASDVIQILVRLGAWQKAEYVVRRDGVQVKANVIISERAPAPALYYQYAVGAAYLAIGLFVFFRRRGASKALHFYVLCLASFVLSSFHYTGKLNNFDKVIYWGNVTAGLLAPVLFLHFALAFPELRGRRRRLKAAVLYLPAALLLALYVGASSGTVRVAMPLLEVRWLLDRAWLAFLTLFYIAGAAVLAYRYRTAEDVVVRQQIKWLRNGAVLGVLPFAALYAAPYIMGSVPGAAMETAVLSLGLIPLTWAWAIIRYRLMDVDIIFQQGYVFTLATVAVLGVAYGLMLSLGAKDDLSPAAVVTLIMIAVFVFQPIRNWIQELLEKHFFYRDRYDYRMTLVEFARELSSETDVDRMLAAVADRLRSTLKIHHIAFFLAGEEEPGAFRLRQQFGQRKAVDSTSLDLSFLSAEPGRPYLFIERTRHAIDVVTRDWPASVRQTIGELDLTYYVPCSMRGRTIAYLGASRTEEGDFLSSDDVDMLLTLARYVGIALENARLYRSLERKMAEYERLKEFSENIVESINVGILAADLADRVESWNTQLEKLTGIPREIAVGRRLAELFPAELEEEFGKVRGETGIHHIYKFVLKPHTLVARVVMGGNGQGESVRMLAEGPREVTLNIAIAPLISKDGTQIGRLIIFDDVTDRAELERRLIQADKLSSIGLLAAGVAHEVNTPLAVISTYAQMLAKQVSGDDQKSRLLDKIARQTFRASEIVNSLLNFSRTSPTEFDELSLNRVIGETLSVIEHQLSKAGIGVRLSLEESLPPVKGNSGKLQQVFLNLFLNARDAMESGGILTIRSWEEEGRGRVEVSDNGQGIAPEYVARIYDPFFTTKAGKKGTGLGLSVTYGIVKEHGGTIEVDSQPGVGTRFVLDFPLARKPVNA